MSEEMNRFPLRRIPRPEGGTEYDEYPEHPLAGVPQAVLDVARGVLKRGVVNKDLDAAAADPLADAVTMELLLREYLSPTTSEETDRLRLYEVALSNIVGVLGPQSVCTCHAQGCGLEIESSEALNYARIALGLDPAVKLYPPRDTPREGPPSDDDGPRD